MHPAIAAVNAAIRTLMNFIVGRARWPLWSSKDSSTLAMDNSSTVARTASRDPIYYPSRSWAVLLVRVEFAGLGHEADELKNGLRSRLCISEDMTFANFIQALHYRLSRRLSKLGLEVAEPWPWACHAVSIDFESAGQQREALTERSWVEIRTALLRQAYDLPEPSIEVGLKVSREEEKHSASAVGRGSVS